jgi:hypothetical protein
VQNPFDDLLSNLVHRERFRALAHNSEDLMFQIHTRFPFVRAFRQAYHGNRTGATARRGPIISN